MPLPVFAPLTTQATRLRPRHIGVRKIVALEQKLRAVRFGAGAGQAIAEIQAGAVFAVFAVAFERGDGAVGDVLADRHGGDVGVDQVGTGLGLASAIYPARA